jgi:SpoIID/LytB domain protein
MIGRSLGLVLLGCFLTIETALANNVKAEDIDLQVGIVQRFGAEPQDEQQKPIKQLTISSTEESLLSLRLLGQQSSQTIQSDRIVLSIQQQPLSAAILSERLVLSSHATFETAEDNANLWKTLGIEVEIAQPGRWEVWAKRDVYPTPLVRRWLMQSLQANGYTTPYLKTEILSSVPQVSIVAQGKSYVHNQVEISSSNNLLAVSVGKNAETSNIYPGKLRLQPNAYGDFTLVNQVPLESYLRGVVPYEIGHQAPPKAIEAQTIIARTYALRNLRRFAVDNYQLCATVHCQVYKGLTGTNSPTDGAIAATKGLVLTYQNQLVDALYSSTSGGVTASFDDIWNGVERPYLKPTIDSLNQIWDLSRYPLTDEANFRHFLNLKNGFNETGRGLFRWYKERKIKDLNQDLGKYLGKINHPLADFTTIKQMEVTKRSPSGRILTLAVTTDKGIVELEKNEARSAFEPPTSTLFYLEPIYARSQQLTAYAFVGGGFGHGVGLSQYGSYTLAQFGWSAEKILSFYYPGTTLQPLDDSIIFWREPQTPLTQNNQHNIHSQKPEYE